MRNRIKHRKATHQKVQHEKLAAGLADLWSALSSLKQDMETRAFLLNLANHDSRYCVHWTPRRVVGEYGPTCCLLGPTGPQKGGYSRGLIKSDWASWARATIGSYRALRNDMNAFGDEVSMEKLFEWQGWAEELRVHGLNQSEIEAERGWRF